LSIQPIDIGLALGLTIGDPEVVGTFANCLFQILHGLILFDDVSKCCSGKVNEMLTSVALHIGEMGAVRIDDGAAASRLCRASGSIWRDLGDPALDFA
jgi:hypothetical protein